MNQKEVYACDLIQALTQAQEDLCTSSNKVEFLEATLESLKISYEDFEAVKEELRVEVEQLKKHTRLSMIN